MPFPLSALRLPSRRTLLRAVLWALFALYVGFAALTLALRYWLLPELPRYQPEIEATASRVLGTPVRIGKLEAHWTGLNPALTLENVRILNEQGEIALNLARVEGALSWRSLISLWQGEPRFALLSLEKPELLIHRAASGDIFVAGILLSGSDEGNGKALDWLLQQSRLRINDARLIWQDDLRAAPPLDLQDVRLEWRNSGSHHAFGLSAQPPAALAAKLDVRGDFRGDADWQDWRGRIYARLDALDLAGGRPWFDAPIELERGHGAARLWLQRDQTGWQGTGDFALMETRLRLDASLPMLDLARLQGRLQVTRVTDIDFAKNGWRIASSDLSLDARTVDDQPIRISNLNLQLEWQGEQFPPRQGALFADTLDLTRLRQLAAWLPLTADSRALLVTHQPKGRLQQVKLRWEMEKEAAALKKYSLEAAFSDLGFKAAGVLPGASGLSGTLSADEKRGMLNLDSKNATIALPAVFADPEFPLDRVQAQVAWQHNAEGIRADIRSFDFTSPHARGKVHGDYQSLPTGPGRINLQGDFTQAKAAEVWRYIPRVCGDEVGEWLHGALRAGSGEAKLKLRGDLEHFPFPKSGTASNPAVNPYGEFKITVKAHDVTLKYGDDWPVIEGLSGDLAFGEGMKILAHSGRALGAKLQNVQVDIPTFAHNQHLLVAGEAVGATTEFLRFIDQSPVAAAIDHFTQGMTATGAGRLELKLDLPLAKVEDGKYSGRYHLENNTIAFMPGLPPAQNVQGSLEFTEASVNAPEIHGQFLGAPMRLKVTSDLAKAGSVRIEANGGLTAQELARQFKYPGMSALSGSASWQAEVKIQKKASEFALTSSLEGLASSLPAPFTKQAGERAPFSLQKTPARDASEQIRIDLGNDAKRRLGALIMLRANGDIERGVIGIGQSANLPDKGLQIFVKQDAVDLDAWRAILAEGNQQQEGGQLKLPFDLLALEAEKLTVFGQVFDSVSLRLRPEVERLRIMVAAQEMVGDLYWNSTGQGKVTADLRRVRLESGQGMLAAQTQQVDKPALIDSLPAMDIRIDDFTYGKRRFGRVELQAENVGRRWRLNQVVIENPAGKLTGAGFWRPGVNGQSNLDFKLDASDSGKLLGHLGYPGAIRGGTAALSGQLQWAGSPLDFDAATLEGNLQLDAQKGQFSKIEPGVGKLLGLLSLQSFTRRLSLDFRDIFSEGFAYDSIAAKMHIADGIMTTDGDLQIIAPLGKTLMNGTVDMKNETQNLNLTMQPELGGVAAVGAAVATLNPLVGAAALLAQNFLKNPLNRIFSLKYTVTGSWAEPNVERVPLLQNESAVPDNPSRTTTEEKTP